MLGQRTCESPLPFLIFEDYDIEVHNNRTAQETVCH